MSEEKGFDEKQKNNDPDLLEEQQFITEKIVSKRKKRWIRRLFTFLFVILCAAGFGVTARYFFLVSGDELIKLFKIEIPVVRETVYVYTEKTPAPTPKPSPTVAAKASVTPVPGATVTPSPTKKPDDVPKTTSEPTPILSVTPFPSAEITPEPDVTATPEITLTPTPGEDPGNNGNDPEEKAVYSYVRFMEEVMEVAQNVKGSIASVDGISTGTSFLGDEYEIRTNTTGLLLGQDGVDVLILTDLASLEEVSRVEVRLEGSDKVYAAKVYNFDRDFGLAIVSVPISSMEKEVFDSLVYGVTCRPEDIKNGLPVFELGRANGYPDSLSFGIISSRGNVYGIKDAEISYFTTNWQIYSGASGFVFNMDGYVVGMLTQSVPASTDRQVPCFITLSAIEDELNILLNGGKLVNLGIYANSYSGYGDDKEEKVTGLYVYQVVAASPAYTAGLRIGDMIVEINGNRMTGMAELMDILTASAPQQPLSIKYYRRSPEGLRELSGVAVLTSK